MRSSGGMVESQRQNLTLSPILKSIKEPGAGFAPGSLVLATADSGATTIDTPLKARGFRIGKTQGSIYMADDDDQKPTIGSRLKASAAKAVGFVKGLVQFDALAHFKSDAVEIDFPIDFGGDTVWATQDQIATLFERDKSVIGKHIRTIFDQGELNEDSVMAKIATTASDGKSYQVAHYNLDVILAVGYRVSSPKAAQFRKWASTVLRGYIEEGYALNGKKLNSDPAALFRLAQEVRAIRTSEKNLYSQVREAFAECAIDYDKDEPVARTFFATAQDIFHYAASEKTAVQIIMSRADATKPNMGLVALGNRRPAATDVTVAKNYCSPEELRKMELIGEGWLLYAEGMAMQGKQVSMERLLNKLSELIKLNEFPVFPGYQRGVPSREQANAFAKRQLDLFRSSGVALPPA